MSIKIMNRVWQCSQQKGSALLLLLAIADNANDDLGYAWPSTDTLAAKIRMHQRQVQRILVAIEEAGELAIIRGCGRYNTNRYYVLAGMDDQEKKTVFAEIEEFEKKGDILPPLSNEEDETQQEKVYLGKTTYVAKISQRQTTDREEPADLTRRTADQITQDYAVNDYAKGVILSPFPDQNYGNLPPFKYGKGDIFEQKGDISEGKGDIQGRKGDIAMSPEPLLTIKDPSENQLEAWEKTLQNLFQSEAHKVYEYEKFYKRYYSGSYLISVTPNDHARRFIVGVRDEEYRPGVKLSDFLNDRKGEAERMLQTVLGDWQAELEFT